MDESKFAKMLSDKHLFELDRMEYKYSVSSVEEFTDGTEEFTTKQLEKDFRNAAYATIRTFVMKFHEMGLLTARKAGNRVFYKIK